MTRSGIAAGGLAAGGVAAFRLAAGSPSDDEEDAVGNGVNETVESASGVRGDGVVDGDVPAATAIFGWIREVFDQGVRRPGYPANQWAEVWIAERLRDIGLQNVRLEPVTGTGWEPFGHSLEVIAGGETTTLECFPTPYSAPAQDLEVELAAYDVARPEAVADRASLYDVTLIRMPAELMARSGSAPDDLTGRIIDPDNTLAGAQHIVPFGADLQEVMEPSIEAGAAAFIGSLTDYPGDSFNYYVPYDGIPRSIPGVWIRGSDGAWLRDRLAQGPMRVRLTVESETRPFEAHNVVGELPGADDETVMIASHHDGPWSSAVEDASGIALVLAQAAYWAAQPVERRPHRLVFLLQAGHMAGGRGLGAYIERHRDELDRVVLEVHLEHAALEFAEVDGTLAPTGQPEPRWFFTSRLAPLEEAVADALETERLHRSMILAPDAFGEQPPTDGAFYHTEGVPVVNFLAAPFYLFDEMDTLDKIDREGLVPLTRATIRIVDSTHGISATELRSA